MGGEVPTVLTLRQTVLFLCEEAMEPTAVVKLEDSGGNVSERPLVGALWLSCPSTPAVNNTQRLPESSSGVMR